MLRDEVLPKEVKDEGFRIPGAYYEVREMGITLLEPWFFLDLGGVQYIYNRFREQYPARLVVPFARSGAEDLVACFVVQSAEYRQGQVVVIKDDQPAGTEVQAAFDGFLGWLRRALDEMLDLLRLHPAPDTWGVQQTCEQSGE